MKSGVFWAKERRSIPASFKLYMGTTPLEIKHSIRCSALVMLCRL